MMWCRFWEHVATWPCFIVVLANVLVFFLSWMLVYAALT